MDNMLVLALALVIGIACAPLIFIQFRRFEEQHESSSHLLKTQTELEIAKKALAGYTKADDYLAQAHKKLVEQAPSFGVSVTREHVHQERFHKDQDKLKADASLLVRYAVTYNYLVDLNAASFVLARETPGIRIRVAPPALQGMPSVKIMSHEVSPPGGLPDERAALAQVQQKLVPLALSHASAIGREDTVRALCKTRLVDALWVFLAAQPGVRHLPCMVVDFQ